MPPSIQLNKQQNEALEAITQFINSPQQAVFILKGYAGTGKTSLIAPIIDAIKKNKKEVMLMAPTGRAAKILSEKTNRNASTIHRVLYKGFDVRATLHDNEGKKAFGLFTETTKNSNGDDDVEIEFGLNQFEQNPTNYVFIVDEASMISAKPINNNYLRFGSNNLINDLINYIQPTLGGKVIFVGDPAQLPPVGDNYSVALDEEFFENLGLGVCTYELSEVVRQVEDSVILRNAMRIRNLILSAKRSTLVFEQKANEVEQVTPNEVVTRYCQISPKPSIGKAVVLCYSNEQVKNYNQAIRKLYYPNSYTTVNKGDVLLVTQNLFSPFLPFPLFNGDFLRVLNADRKTEAIKEFVWYWENGERKNRWVTVEFRNVELETEQGEVFSYKIIDSLLNSPTRNIDYAERICLYKNLLRRYNAKNLNKYQLLRIMLQDEFFNAMHVKYGYAITCHKAQGGEWQTVFVDYSAPIGLDDNALRWRYTATTRAKKQLFGVNLPNITP